MRGILTWGGNRMLVREEYFDYGPSDIHIGIEKRSRNIYSRLGDRVIMYSSRHKKRGWKKRGVFVDNEGLGELACDYTGVF